MAADIRAAANSNNPPEALIVTIPSDSVKAAVSDAIESGLPVFGMYKGYEYYEELEMQGFIAMDQQEAGAAAGKRFNGIKGTTAKAAYVTPVITDEDFDAKRLEGLRSEIDNVEEIEKSSMITMFKDCPYDAVLLASSELLEYALKAYEENGCDYTTNPIATFDTSKDIHIGLSSGKLAFTVSSAQYLQGAFSVMAATMFATNGKALAPSSESTFGMQTVGPVITTKQYPLTDSEHECQNDAFPVCPYNKALDGVGESLCDCTDRKKIKIAGVLHAVTTDEFWDVIYESTQHAADDFGVELILDRLEPNDDPDILHEKMAAQIESLCKQSVDGIFVTIPHEIVLEEIELCLKLNVPVVSINAGPEYSKNLELYHHIGMVEKNAGKQAGRRMASSDQKMTKALCLMHAKDNVVLTDRCGGFEAGVAEINPGIEYLGSIDVPADNEERYKKIVESHLKDKMGDDGNGDWEGIGILLPGQPQIAPGLMLKDYHPGVMLGVFDTNEQLFNALDVGKIMFAIDQGPYLQGYLPVSLLTLYAYTKQQLANHLVESGPAFITRAPSAEESACQAAHFPVCPKTAAATPQADTTATDSNVGIIVTSVIIVVLALAVIFLSYRVIKLKRFVRKVRCDGQEVPKLTAGSYVSGIYQSPEEVVRKMTPA